MHKKFLILFFVTIFYSGVSHCIPIDGQIPVVKVAEEIPPKVSPTTSVADNTNKEIDAIPPRNKSTSAIENVTSQAQPVGEAPIKTATAHSDDKNPTENHQNVDIKKVTQDAVDNKKINTHVIDNNNDKNQTVEGKNATQTTDNKNTSKPAEEKHVTVPTPVSKSTTENSVATPAVRTVDVSTTPAAAGPNTTTAVNPPITKATVTTVIPTSSSKDNIIAEQNTQPPAQEKHFDGPSFVGGIVLTIGLTAIGFIAFKYYKSGKIDMNYRTL